MEFKAWLEQQGCVVEVTQPDDGGGYVCLDVVVPDTNVHYDITVTA